MGDGYGSKHRLYPTITDLHTLDKRGAYHIEDGKKVSDVEFLIYPPTHGFIKRGFSIDTRAKESRIKTEPARDVIASVSLSEFCMGASGFISAKESSRNR